MLEEFVQAVLQPICEIVCYWVGKIIILPFGLHCSLDDEWGYAGIN
jgi:hypothetical protein